jgi:hypothetical protein
VLGLGRLGTQPGLRHHLPLAQPVQLA